MLRITPRGRSPFSYSGTPLAAKRASKPLEIVHIPPGKLKPASYNPRSMSDKARNALKRGIEAFGLVDPIIARRSDKLVVGGHQRLHAAKELGLATVPVVFLDLDDQKAAALNVLLNNPAAQGEWDFGLLSGLLSELDAHGFDATLTGFDEKELEGILSWTPESECGLLPGVDPDEAPPLPAEPITKLGDLMTLGRHRLLCGDSTKAEDVARLMDGNLADLIVTDPPYGVGYTGGAKPREAVQNDHVGTTIYADSLCHLRKNAADHAALYLWYADANAAAAAAAAAAAGYDITAQIIWVKNNAQFVTSAHYKGKHEACFYAHRRGKVARWEGENNEVTVWEVDRAHKNEFHPTQKPVELARHAIENSSRKSDLVLDLFGGSGSTLMAAEISAREACLMEIDPGYCDVIVARWETATGQKAERPS